MDDLILKFALLRELVSQVDGRQTLYRCTGSGKVWTVFQPACWRLLQSSPLECWTLEPCGWMKMANSWKEGTAANRRRSGLEGHMFKTWYQQGLFIVESLLKSTLPLEICFHNNNSCVKYIGRLHICLTHEKCVLNKKVYPENQETSS